MPALYNPRLPTRMKFLYDLFPLLLFFAAYKISGIFIATGVAIVASVIQVAVFRLRHGRYEPMHVVTLAIIAVFGGLTIALHDDTFIRWKPTLVYWILGGALLGSQWLGGRTLIDRLLGDKVGLPPAIWRRLNLSWGLFFLVLGGLNLYVAFYYRLDLDAAARQELWVNFKVFGLMAITLIFALVQGVYMARHVQDKPQTGADRAPE
jgi:intracellular septation protein